MVSEPTRENSILDLVITNNSNLIAHISIENSGISDHSQVNCILHQSPNFLPANTYLNSISDNSLGIKHSKKFFRDINRGNIDYEKLNKELHKVDWDALHQSCSVEEFPRVLNTTVLEVTKKCIPEDTKRNDKKPKLSSSQRKRRLLLKKKKASSEDI